VAGSDVSTSGAVNSTVYDLMVATTPSRGQLRADGGHGCAAAESAVGSLVLAAGPPTEPAVLGSHRAAQRVIRLADGPCAQCSQ
jgi:hypothetical protein